MAARLGFEMNGMDDPGHPGALARSTIYDFLAGLFAYHDQLEEVADRLAGTAESVVAAAEFLQDLGYRLDVEDALQAVQAVGDIAALTDIQAEYVALFDRPSKGHSLSPFESVQRKGMVDLHTLAALREFYQRFGLALAPDAAETADHSSVEFAFMSFLAFREAEAVRLGQDADGFARAQAAFLGEHIMQWMPGWLDKLAASARHPYFAAAAALAATVLAEDARTVGALAVQG